MISLGRVWLKRCVGLGHRVGSSTLSAVTHEIPPSAPALLYGESRIKSKGGFAMRFSPRIRAALFALTAFAGLAAPSVASAESGTIAFSVLKAGWFIGGSGGSGTLFFQGRRYPISIGGLSAGFVFGASETHFRGTVRHIRSPYDVSGVYGAAGAGAAVGAGAQFIVLQNEKGAVLELAGRQVGLQINADISGLSISVR
jgi:hypothetical protein